MENVYFWHLNLKLFDMQLFEITSDTIKLKQSYNITTEPSYKFWLMADYFLSSLISTLLTFPA